MSMSEYKKRLEDLIDLHGGTVNPIEGTNKGTREDWPFRIELARSWPARESGLAFRLSIYRLSQTAYVDGRKKTDWRIVVDGDRETNYFYNVRTGGLVLGRENYGDEDAD